jgi:hypothetical protein
VKIIKVVKGQYKLFGVDTNMAGSVFPMVKDYQVGKNGGYITVDATPVPGFPDRNIRIRVDSKEDYEIVKTDEPEIEPEIVPETKPVIKETDEEIKNRLRSRFQILTDMTKAVKRGDVNALIVSGAPGVGKSHGIEEVMQRYETMELLGMERKHEVIKGNLSAIGLYAKLYSLRKKDNVVIFDDCDTIFEEVLPLNILKAALDSKPKRTISWNTDSYKLRNEDVPASFVFEGSAIFVTNMKFSNVRSKKLRDHIEALESRCHYLDLTIDTYRDKLMRIHQVIEDGMMEQYDFGDDMINNILEYVEQNHTKFRELSLRTIVKLADLIKAFPDSWQDKARHTLMCR